MSFQVEECNIDAKQRGNMVCDHFGQSSFYVPGFIGAGWSKIYLAEPVNFALVLEQLFHKSWRLNCFGSVQQYQLFQIDVLSVSPRSEIMYTLRSWLEQRMLSLLVSCYCELPFCYCYWCLSIQLLDQTISMLPVMNYSVLHSS